MTPNELELYFARVGYTGPREPTLDVLHALTAAHSQTIPFENLDVLLGAGIDIQPEAVFAKLIERQRGGYCFEQNGLFLRVLTALGFEAVPLSARVLRGQPRTHVPARTHMFVRVLVDGSAWLTDVGIGSNSLTAAIRFELDLEQETPHEARRIVRDGALYYHQAKLGADWSDIYVFTGEEMPLIDREVGNWYTSTHPRSHFAHDLMVARAQPDGRRVAIVNRELKRRHRDGRAEVTLIESERQLLQVLEHDFGIKLPASTRFPGHFSER